ncbi:sensor histidine kinase, partial [Piscinibacter sp.]|uniref:sensor histidine kinase n=1 Tax=Piscinibacter sp. TaxID=1903157 RepID=UPI002B64BF2C
FEYILHRPERAHMQERRVASRLDQLLATHPFSDPEAKEILSDLRERSAATQRIFAELLAAPSVDDGTAADPNTMRRFEAQLSRQLLILQQESLVDAFRLSDYSTARISEAQRRVVIVFLAGLVLIGATTGGAGWLIHRGVLAPIRRLEQATREVAAGNWNFKLDIGGDDEIGEMSRNFDAMTSALRSSFAQIERSNQELAALNKEIEAFSYSVSHDLRAPLRSMDGFSLALLEDYGDKLDNEARDSLHRIRAASQRMGRLIDELLGLSRVTRTELAIRPIDLSVIAREIAASLQQQHPDRTVRFEIDDGLKVRADRSLMQIAMQNLLENAWKFTAKTEQPVIRVGRAEHNGTPACFVSDNGVGFDMAYADRLFGAFQRLHHESEFSGTGIGLAIVQRIVRRHDGKIWAQSQPARGATFFFTLGDHGHERRQQSDLAG